MSEARDPFGLLSRRRSQVMLGFTDVTGALRDGNYRGTIEDRDSMTLRLDPDMLPPDPVDYLAPVEFRFRGSQGQGRRREFVGHTATAVEDPEGLLDLEAYGAMLLTERAIGYFAHDGLTAAEITYLLARSAGMSDEQLSIPDLDELPIETFEVIAPLYGITVVEATELVGVTVVPAGDALAAMTEMGFDAGDLDQADSYALSLDTHRLGFHAERAGLDAIDLAIDWLATRLRYGLALLPDGTVQPFDRETRRALPRRRTGGRPRATDPAALASIRVDGPPGYERRA